MAALPDGALADAKAYLRIDGADEDAVLETLIDTAMALCERFTGQALILADRTDILAAAMPAWQRLPATPVSAITSVSALDGAGTATALPIDAYAIDVDAVGDGWVRLTRPVVAFVPTIPDRPAPQGRLQIGYRAGLAPDWPSIPPALRQGVVRLAAHLHAHRDEADDAGPPAAVAALWRPFRRMQFA